MTVIISLLNIALNKYRSGALTIMSCVWVRLMTERWSRWMLIRLRQRWRQTSRCPLITCCCTRLSRQASSSAAASRAMRWRWRPVTPTDGDRLCRGCRWNPTKNRVSSFTGGHTVSSVLHRHHHRPHAVSPPSDERAPSSPPHPDQLATHRPRYTQPLFNMLVVVKVKY